MTGFSSRRGWRSAGPRADHVAAKHRSISLGGDLQDLIVVRPPPLVAFGEPASPTSSLPAHLRLEKPVTITFGLMATPVKPSPVGDPFWFRFGDEISAQPAPVRLLVIRAGEISTPGKGH